MSKPTNESSAGQGQFLTGHFLISINRKHDPNFQQTVMLMINHDADGAFGLIINRPTGYNFGQIMERQSNAIKATSRIGIYFGGPVNSTNLFVLHSGLPASVQTESAYTTVPNVVFEPLQQSLVEYLHREWDVTPVEMRPPVRFYAGYAGWAEKQLERELLEKSWIVSPSTVKHIFHPNPEQRWWEMLNEMGGTYRLMAMSGIDPALN